MFTQFLHPELVLFGNFLNQKIICQHPVQMKDGQIVVHQKINRIWNISQSSEQVNRQQHKQYCEDDLDEQQMRYLREQAEQDYQEEEQEEVSDDENGYEQDDGFSPYGVGYKMTNQYMPEQLVNFFNGQASAQNSPVKTSQVPFFKNSPKKQIPSQEVQNGQQDDGGWETQEQEEDYVTNQLIEEAGGNFAAQI